MRTTLVLLTLALLAAPAMAQPGPAPGYDSALDYAADHAAAEAENASADPVGFAGSKATASGLQNETSHAAYVACWAADDAGVQHELCDPYYTARGHEPPSQPPCECQENATAAHNDTQAFANATHNATLGYAGNATAFINETVADPGNATSHAGRFLNTTKHFVLDLVDDIVGLVTVWAGAILTCLGVGFGFGLESIDLGITGIGAVFATLGDAAVLGALGIGDIGQATGDGAMAALGGLGGALGAIGSGLATAASATGGALATAAGAVGGAIVTAAQATGDGIHSVGEAIGDAAKAVKDAVVGLFDDGPKPQGGSDPVDDVTDTVGTDGLLDGVTGILS